MLFVDTEVFKHDWLLVGIDPVTGEVYRIHNNQKELETLYDSYKNDIWVAFNGRNYDLYIIKGILLGFNPKEINDFIIVDGNKGFKFSKLFNNIKLNMYDPLQNHGLKTLEAFQGHDIYETEVDFNLDRNLTFEELKQSFEYCYNDTMELINVFVEQKKEFDALFGLIKMYDLPLSCIGKTKPQLSAIILDATKPIHSRGDEFDLRLVDTIKLDKYKYVIDWFMTSVEDTKREMIEKCKNTEYKELYLADYDNLFKTEFYKREFTTEVSGVEHKFGWGGLHGARTKYHGKGLYLHIDVNSFYPNLMRVYNLLSRNVVDPSKFTDIIQLRLKYKAEKNKLQEPLKIVLNSTYGASKDINNQLYDPLMANLVCINGQLLLLDLLEKLESVSSYELIQLTQWLN